MDIPQKLQTILGSDPKIAGETTRYLASISTILKENQLPFFPDFTDHGIEHVSATLETQCRLIPPNALPLLTAADAAVIICSTLLHDLGMHMREKAFLLLIRGEAELRSEKNLWPNDPPWQKLWSEFTQEAARFSDQQSYQLFGELPADRKPIYKVADQSREWDTYERLLIGEFLRRHHPRLAFQIAMQGIPGSEEATSLDAFLPQLSQVCGLVARSHGMQLRDAILKLKETFTDIVRPYNAFIPYAMALLRVADFLQIGPRRGPMVLLSLRDPPSRRSVEEWKLQNAVEYISFDNIDPREIRIQATPNIGPATYLKLTEVMELIQYELDRSVAVLSETYGRFETEGFVQLNLNKSRITSNLQEASFCERLSFVPRAIKLSSDPRLLSLIVEPLYAGKIEFAFRELLQNAVDAIKERSIYESVFKNDLKVSIVLAQIDEENWRLDFCDTGIGMSLQTIQSYFLTAGASFRDSADWRKAFVNENGRSTVLRAGRFGIGVFSAFLLSNQIDVVTRHADSEFGYSFSVRCSDDFITLRRKNDAPVGTTISVSIPASLLSSFDQKALLWYLSDWPKIHLLELTLEGMRIFADKGEEIKPEVINGGIPEHDQVTNNDATWRKIFASKFDSILWTCSGFPKVVCNGIRISRPAEIGDQFEDCEYVWVDQSLRESLDVPSVSIADPDAELPLSLRRDELIGKHLPFSHELESDVCLDFIAYAMQNGPTQPLHNSTLLDYARRYPLARRMGYTTAYLTDPLTFASTDRGFIPAMQEFLQLINFDYICGIGTFGREIEPVRLKNVCPPETLWIPCINWQDIDSSAVSNESIYNLIADASTIRQFLGHRIKGLTLFVTSPSHLMASSGEEDQMLHPNFLSERDGAYCYSIDFNGPKIATDEIEDLLLAMSQSKSQYYYRRDICPSFLLLMRRDKLKVETEEDSLLLRYWKEAVGSREMPFEICDRRAKKHRRRVNTLRNKTWPMVTGRDLYGG